MQHPPAAPPPPSIWAELVKDLTDLDRGIVGTLRDLLLRPRQVLEGRLRYPNPEYFAPFKLLLLVGGAYALLANTVLDYDQQVEQSIAALRPSAPDQQAQYWLGFVQQGLRLIRDYQSLLSLSYVPFVAWLSRWAFRRQQPEFRAHAYAWAYFYCIQYLLGLVILLVLWIVNPSAFSGVPTPAQPGAPTAAEFFSVLLGLLGLFCVCYFPGRLMGIAGFGRRLGLGLIALVGSVVASMVLTAAFAAVYVLLN